MRLKPTREKPRIVPGKPPGKQPAVTPPSNPYGLDPRVLPYVAPQLAALAAQRAEQEKSITEFTKMMLSKLAEFGPSTAATYDTAINQSRDLAQAGSDSLRQANGNTDIQAILRAAGAPEAQQQQVATNLGNVFNGGAAALFGRQGIAPGQQLITDKASNVAFGNALPGISSLAGTAALKSLLAMDEASRQKVLAQAPGILANIQQADATAKYRADTLGLSRDRIDIQRKNANKASKPQVFGSTVGGYWAYDATTRKLTQLSTGTGPRPLAPKIFGSDKTGRYVYDPNTQTTTPLTGPAPGTKKQKFTNVQIAQFKNQAADYAKFAWEGEFDSDHGQWLSQPVHYIDALAMATDHGIPMWIAQGALKRYWTKPGYDADIASRAKASQNGDPIKPVWFKSSTGPKYARGKAPKAGAAAKPAAYTIGGIASPVAGSLKLIGGPYQGTHAKAFNARGGSDNWESENAYDISVPVGTPIYASTSGVIGPQFGSLGEGGRFAGLRLHLVGGGNEFYYAHLSSFAPGIKPGARVKAGQVIGYSGTANGVAHLHFAAKSGDPLGRSNV